MIRATFCLLLYVALVAGIGLLAMTGDAIPLASALGAWFLAVIFGLGRKHEKRRS